MKNYCSECYFKLNHRSWKVHVDYFHFTDETRYVETLYQAHSKITVKEKNLVTDVLKSRHSDKFNKIH